MKLPSLNLGALKKSIVKLKASQLTVYGFMKNARQLALMGFALAAATANAALPIESIKLPPGFEISLFAENVTNARSLVLGDNLTLFVSTRNEGKVYAIKHNGIKAQKVILWHRD